MAAGRTDRPVRFRETRKYRRMTDAIVLTGTLSLGTDGALIRIVTTPNYEKAVIRGDQVRLWQRRDGIGRTAALADYPLLQGMVRALRGVLTGKAEALNRHFRLRLEAAPEGAWQLHLTPRNADVARRLSAITVSGTRSGTGAAVRQLLLTRARDGRATGDWIRIDLLP